MKLTSYSQAPVWHLILKYRNKSVLINLSKLTVTLTKVGRRWKSILIILYHRCMEATFQNLDYLKYLQLLSFFSSRRFPRIWVTCWRKIRPNFLPTIRTEITLVYGIVPKGSIHRWKSQRSKSQVDVYPFWNVVWQQCAVTYENAKLWQRKSNSCIDEETSRKSACNPTKVNIVEIWIIDVCIVVSTILY